MKKRDQERIEKLWNSENENDKIKAIAASKKLAKCEIFGTGSKCERCNICAKNDSIIADICSVVAVQAKEKKAAKIRSERPWDLVVEELFHGIMPRKDLVTLCIQQYGMSESAAKDFINSAGCVMNSITGKNKKPGLVSAMIEWLKSGEKGPEPEGSKNLKYYCKSVWHYVTKNDDIMVTLLK